MADVERLESLLDSHSKAIKKILTAEDLEEFRLIFRRPGWTTPAEALLVEGILEGMTEQANILASMQRSALRACQAVE
jgi:hypothetical protein